MRDRIDRLEATLLPRGRGDAARQLLLFAGAYLLYELVRGVADNDDVARATWNATRVIDLERTLHVFVEPSLQAWTSGHRRLMELADWTYLNAHFSLTGAVLAFIYVRRNESYYQVRNAFLIAMLFALLAYALYPTAPPRLMPQWGFTDPIRELTGIDAERGPGSALLNLYAAIPSMHVCFALLVGVPMSRTVASQAARTAWRLYPVFIAWVVIVTGNHYLLDVVLGALTAGASALLAARVVPHALPRAAASRQATA